MYKTVCICGVWTGILFTEYRHGPSRTALEHLAQIGVDCCGGIRGIALSRSDDPPRLCPCPAKPYHDISVGNDSTAQHKTRRKRGGKAKSAQISFLSSHLFVDHDGAEKSGIFLAIILGRWSGFFVPFLPFPWVLRICTVRSWEGEGGGGDLL